jgi:prevent-host-death family protein
LAVEPLKMETIPLTKAKARLSEIVARLIHRKEAVVITRKRHPVAVIVPFEEWIRNEQASPKDGLAAAAGALADYDAEIDAMVETIYAARVKAKDRKVAL